MDTLIIEGRIVQKMDPVDGVSARGAWKKQEFVVETAEQYPKKVCIVCWNEKIDELRDYQVNESIRVSVNIESREFNNRWYTDVKAWRLERPQAGTPTPPPPPMADHDDPIGVSFSDEDTELPF